VFSLSSLGVAILLSCGAGMITCLLLEKLIGIETAVEQALVLLGSVATAVITVLVLVQLMVF
jgi:hypothetical protein